MLATPAQAEYTVSTFAGSTGTLGSAAPSGITDGAAASALFDYPYGIAVSPDGLTVYICDTVNYRIRKVTGGVVSTFAGPSGTEKLKGTTDGAAASALFNGPSGIAVSPDGLTVYICDTVNQRIRGMRASWELASRS